MPYPDNMNWPAFDRAYASHTRAEDTAHKATETCMSQNRAIAAVLKDARDKIAELAVPVPFTADGYDVADVLSMLADMTPDVSADKEVEVYLRALDAAVEGR